MKRIIFTVALIAILARFSAIAGWQTINGVKTLPFSGSSISQLSANAFDNKFYIFKGDSLIFYNMSGDIDSVKVINDTTNYLKRQVSSDGNTCAYWFNRIEYQNFYLDYFIIDNISKNKLVSDAGICKYSLYGPDNGSFSSNVFYYNSTSKSGFINGNINYSNSHGGSYNSYSNGASYIIVNNTLSKIDSRNLDKFTKNRNGSVYLFKSSSSSDYGTYRYDSQTTYSSNLQEGEIFALYFTEQYKETVVNQYYHKKNYQLYGGTSDTTTGSRSANLFAIANNINKFITIEDTSCAVWSFDTSGAKIVKTFPVVIFATWTTFSNDDKYLILTYPNYISIVNTNTWEESEKIVVDAWMFDLTSNGKNIICASNIDNSIHLLEPKTFSNDTLLPTFETNKKIIYQNDSISFTNYSIGSPDSVNWDFGDGTFSNAYSPTHIFSNAGIYTIKLTAYKGTRQNVIENDSLIQVNEKPFNIVIEADTTSGVQPLTVHFKSDKTSKYVLQRWWSFVKSDGVTSTEENPTVTFTASGDYTISLTVFNGIDTLKYTYPTKISISAIPLRNDSILEYVDTNSIPSKGYEGYIQPNGGIYIRGVYNDTNRILRYDGNFNLKENTPVNFIASDRAKCKLVRDGDNVLYYPYLNSSNKQITVKEIEQNNTSSDFYTLNNNNVFDIAPLKNGVCAMFKDNSRYINCINIHESGDTNGYFNKLDTQYYTPAIFTIINSKLFSSIPYNLDFLFFTLKQDASSYGYGITYDSYFLDSSRTYFHNNETYIANDVMVLNKDTAVLLYGFELRYLRLDSSNIYRIDTFSNTINGITRYSDTSFVAYGSKNNGYAECCWYAIMDVNGNTLNEVFLDNRYGAFNYCSIDDNNRLLFSGYLNFANGSGTAGGKGKVKNEKILTDSSSAGTRLYCLIDKRSNIISKVEESAKYENNYSLAVKPNPASENIVVSMNLDKELAVSVKLYDIRGSLVGIIADGHYSGAQSFDFDAKSLSSGTYYIRANIGGREYTQKAVVAH